MRRTCGLVLVAALGAALGGCAGPAGTGAPAAPLGSSSPAPPAVAPAADRSAPRLPADPQAIADAMRGASVVLLGEVHDHRGQHALRAAALERLVAGGARPAIAFEQIDRERQADVERARRERPGDAQWLIARVRTDGWDWASYRPFVELALRHDLPIVAANLSRADAARVLREGFGAVFDAPAATALGLDALPAPLLDAHVRQVADGHCGLMPEAMLAPMARAQIARDAVLAASIAPHADRGVVLLTGNGHARRDLGVARWLPEAVRARTVSIGLLEPEALAATPGAAFDRVVATPAVPREDPCEALRARLGGRGAAAPAAPPSPQGR